MPAEEHRHGCVLSQPLLRTLLGSLMRAVTLAPGYVSTPLSKAGTPVKVEVRGKVNDAVVTKMPFVPTHYFKG